MSFISGIESAFSKVEKTLLKLFGSASVEQKVSATIAVIAPFVTTIITLAAGAPIAAAVSGVMTQVQSDLAAAVTVIQSANANGPATAKSLLAAVQANLQSLLTDADVKNSAKFSEIETAANTVISEIEAVAAAL